MKVKLIRALMFFLIAIFIVLTISCGGNGGNGGNTTTEQPKNSDIEILDFYTWPGSGNYLNVIYDKKRDVTCWIYIRDSGNTGEGGGIFCLEGKR